MNKYNRAYQIKNGYKPVVSIEGDEIGLAKTAKGALVTLGLQLKRLGLGGMGEVTESDIKLIDDRWVVGG